MSDVNAEVIAFFTKWWTWMMYILIGMIGKAEVIAFFTKWWTWMMYILIGMIGKAGYNLMKRKKVTLIYAIGSTCVAALAGFIAAMWCISNAPEKGPYLVPIATLLSDKLLAWLHQVNWKVIIDKIMIPGGDKNI